MKHILFAVFIGTFLIACAKKEEKQNSTLTYKLEPIPDVPEPLNENSVDMADASHFKEVKLDLPVSEGPFDPTWKSIEANYPGTPEWLREAKLGLWVHFGPQSAGESGDWYARRLYVPGTSAYKNHLKNYGHPSTTGYKEVLRDWSPDKLNPEKLVKIYKDAGIRYLIIQGVHHDQFDMWDSKYQPWNSTNLGPKRDLVGEWQKAAREANIRFGITFHHEYSWWWWQTAFQSDTTGNLAGIPYDGNLTLADGEGQWWEGMDPRYLYGVNLREYKGVSAAANSPWSPPPAGIFKNHLKFSNWYAKWWALRMMDAVDKYQPDFIYTDGTDQQPFSGFGTGTGYKSDAIQRVIADYYNKTLARRGEIDVFSIIKFRNKTNGTVNTQEGGIPGDIKTDQDWIAETPVGDWFYGPGFNYSSDAVVRYLLEEVSRDGNIGICVSLLPDGSLDKGSTKMLKEIGAWMKINGEGIYGSHAWEKLGEGINGQLNVLPGGKIGDRQANHPFSTSDIRFTVGKDGSLYAWVMSVPKAREVVKITSLGLNENRLTEPISSLTLLGYESDVNWEQKEDALHITFPENTNLKTAIGFKIGPASIVRPKAPLDVKANNKEGSIGLSWASYQNADYYIVKRAEHKDGPYKTVADHLKTPKWKDSIAEQRKLYYYTITAKVGQHFSSLSEPVAALLSNENHNWNTANIGDVRLNGNITQSKNTVLMKGAGNDIWSTKDAFYFAYSNLSGDGSIITKVESMDNTSSWAKAGVMIRETLNPESSHLIAFVTPSEGVALQGRKTKFGQSEGFAQTHKISAPRWIKLERKGNTFTAFQSEDGQHWIPVGSTTAELASNVKIGLAVCSHNEDKFCNVLFKNVIINQN